MSNEKTVKHDSYIKTRQSSVLLLSVNLYTYMHKII